MEGHRKGELRALISWSALLGFGMGIGLAIVMDVGTRIIEGPHYFNAAYAAGFAVASGIFWALLCMVCFTIMWRRLKPAFGVGPLLSRVALIAFLLQAAVFVAYDLLITRLDLRPWIDDHVDESVFTAAELAVAVVPALVAAYVGMRVAGCRVRQPPAAPSKVYGQAEPLQPPPPPPPLKPPLDVEPTPPT